MFLIVKTNSKLVDTNLLHLFFISSLRIVYDAHKRHCIWEWKYRDLTSRLITFSLDFQHPHQQKRRVCLSLSLCMRVSVSVCVSTCLCASIYLSLFVCAFVCLFFVFLCVCVSVWFCLCVYVCICLCECVYVCVNILCVSVCLYLS